jgi:hypothetical protein
MIEDRDRLSTRDLAGRAPASADPRGPDPELERSGGGGAMQATAADEVASTPMFPEEEARGYRTRWDAVQTGFVDEPRRAVEEADVLVAEVMRRLAEEFAREREQLEHHWDRGAEISTEDLRLALRRYRSFFHRLLSI